LSQLFQELKRRNVFRVAIAYLAVAWLVLQAADIVLDNIAAPDWLMKAVMFFMVIGFPIAVIFAWAFEMTPEGIKKEAEVDRSASIVQDTGKKLNRVIIGVLGTAVVFLLVDKFVLDDQPTVNGKTEQSVAVLPFVAMSRGPDDEYFADGLTEEILNSLTRVPELLVTARTSAFHFKGQDLPIPEIAATLGVAHIVEGSVRREGQRLRITAQLIRAADGFHLWSENYDRDNENSFDVQTDIAEKIAIVLGVVLDDEQLEKMHAAGLRDPAAFVAFQKGVEAYSRAHGAGDMQIELLTAANGWFEDVLEIAPNFSAAHRLHSDLYAHLLVDAAFDDDIPAAEQDRAMQQLMADLDNGIRSATSPSRRLSITYDKALLAGQWQSLTAIVDEIVSGLDGHYCCSVRSCT
jgi:TolB-like protein